MTIQQKLKVCVACSIIAISAYANPTDNVLQVELVDTQVLSAGQENTITLRLTHKESGAPVLSEELKTVHTEKIHLLIIDPMLEDYHHIHPQPGDQPGEYVFNLTPETSYDYRIWVDVVPVNGQQEYVIVDLPGTAMHNSTVDFSPKYVDTGTRFTSTLMVDADGLVVDKPTHAMLVIEEADQPFDQLEPIMGAYAHLVGFYDDFETIAHVHPMGESPQSPDDRSGPVINFHLMPEQAGMIRFFNQIQADETEYFASFTVQVTED